MYLTVEEIKEHLNINQDFIEDDEYLLGLMEAATLTIERHIDNKLEVLVGFNGGVLPSPLIQAIKLLVGTWYANRESVAFSTPSEVPMTVNYILSLYKNYSTRDNVE